MEKVELRGHILRGPGNLRGQASLTSLRTLLTPDRFDIFRLNLFGFAVS